MDFDIPTDLIDKAQIGFREAAGLSSFDRNATNLPSISTVEASISSLDPSPSYLRCKFCQGKLLRGLQSLICIYCGEYQKKDLHPDPISFNSTHGYSWLLQSLNFNGSERIGSLAEGSGVNGEQSPAEDELTLSKLLDLKISWREPEKPNKNLNIKTSEHNTSLNLGTTDFDNFFTKSTSKSAIVSDVLEERPIASKADQNTIVGGQENFTSEWNAEFQFADTKMENEKPESVDLFNGAEADLSVHMDVAFGQTESFEFKKLDNDSDPFQDDLFANLSSATFQQNVQLDSVLQAKDGLSGDPNDFNLKDADGDWFSDGSMQKSSVKNTLKDVSLRDNPNDSTTDWFENTNWQKSSTNNTSTIKDENLFDIKPHANDMVPSEKSDLDNSDNHNSDVTDWFQNSQWAIGGSSSTANVVASKDDDGFGEWNDFTSSTGNQDSLKESGTEKVDYGTRENMSEINLFQSKVDSQDVDFGNFLQSDIFSGDKNLTYAPAVYEVDYGTSENMSQINLFQSKADSQDVDFGNFLQSDVFSGDKNPTHTPAVYDIFSEVSTGNRNANTESGKNDEITLDATTSTKDDVQMLMSQMHDLSFMLENELSVPSRPADIGTSHS